MPNMPNTPNSIFRMETAKVHSEGVRLKGLADDFGTSRNKIKEIVDRMLASDYTSDDAKAIAEEIRRHDPMLMLIQNKIEGHGNFGIKASNQTMGVQEDIITKVNGGR